MKKKNPGLGYDCSCKHDNYPHLGCESWPMSHVKFVFWSTLESSFRVLF